MYFPVWLDLEGRYCVVVGGGQVAERKVETFKECGARVAVVAPEVTPTLARYAACGEVIYAPRAYRSTDLQSAVLGVAATDEPELNQRIAEDGGRLGVPVDVVDDASVSGVLMPAVLRQGRLEVAVSTGGAVPGLAARFRDELAECIKSDYGAYGELIELAAEARQIVQQKYPQSRERAAAMDRILDSEVLALLRAGRRDEAEELIRRCI